MAGRKTKLTHEVQETVCRLIRSGAYRHVAAEYVGVSRRTLERWFKDGEARPRSVYASFRRAVLEAECEAEIRLSGVVYQAAVKGNLKAAYFWLGRKFPDRWGMRKFLEHRVEARDEDELERIRRERMTLAEELEKRDELEALDEVRRLRLAAAADDAAADEDEEVDPSPPVAGNGNGRAPGS